MYRRFSSLTSKIPKTVAILLSGQGIANQNEVREVTSAILSISRIGMNCHCFVSHDSNQNISTSIGNTLFLHNPFQQYQYTRSSISLFKDISPASYDILFISGESYFSLISSTNNIKEGNVDTILGKIIMDCQSNKKIMALTSFAPLNSRKDTIRT